FFFFSSRRRHTSFSRDWSSDVCSSDLEGATRRMSFGLSGPISESLSFRLYGNLNKTDSDDPEINKGHQTERGGANANSLPAGRRSEERRVGKERRTGLEGEPTRGRRSV